MTTSVCECANRRSEGNIGASDQRERELRQGTDGRMRVKVQVVGGGVCAVKKKRTILVLKTGQRRDVRGNVATLQSVELNDVVTFGATSRRYRELD